MRCVSRRRGNGILLCFFAVAAAAACAGETRAPADTSSATAAPSAAAAFASPVANIPAAAITGMLNAAGRWQQYPTQAKRPCKGTPGCASKADSSTVQLWAFTGAKNIGTANAGDTAIMIGKIRNLGPAATERYNLAANKVYAIFIMRGGGSADTGRYEIWEVQGSAKSMADSGQYIPCNHSHLKWTNSFAVFTDCDHPPTEELKQDGPFWRWTRTTLGDSSSAGAAMTHDDGPAWFTCTVGCCTAGEAL